MAEEKILFTPEFVYILMAIALFSPFLFHTVLYDKLWFRAFLTSHGIIIYSVIVFTIGIVLRVRYSGYKNRKPNNATNIRGTYRFVFVGFALILYAILMYLTKGV